MTKAELILKIAKNVGIPDADTKKFFELLLKKISAIIDVGQSVFVKEFGYFHLIKGTIKKPLFSFKDNEVSEEEVNLILFSEDKDLKKSDTKGLVFNIPIFDDDDYHPIDSAFSLSIGKPLIPLRGVPFENIYIPTSGYEYKRLIESKVEKIVGSSEIIETVEKFPTLVIDARSYNSNQVHLQWNEEATSNASIETTTGEFVEEKPELSEYEKQSNELKNIAWDFGENLSKQIEAESILDITNERLHQDLEPKNGNSKDTVKEPQFVPDFQYEPKIEDKAELQNEPVNNEPEFIEEINLEVSSAKLDELLEADSNKTEVVEDDFNLVVAESESLISETITEEFIQDDRSIEIKDEIPEVNELIIEDEPADEDFWKSTSKYFEPYNPSAKIVEENKDNLELPDDNFSEEVEQEVFEQEESYDEPVQQDFVAEENLIEEQEQLNEVEDEVVETIENESTELRSDEIVMEKVEEHQPEFYEPEKKRNFIPFILFPLLIIIVSVALYWYLEYYKKNETAVKPKQIALKTNNANIISRDFDIPVSYPYKPKDNQSTISEIPEQKTVIQNNAPEKIEEKKTEPVKTEEKKVADKKTELTEKITKTAEKTGNKEIINTLPTNTKALNVGGNIYKYGNYYVVQVAAFRSLSISENEAGKYRNKGLNAFVETAEIPDRGTWYRVRVGNFSSKEEAQRFLDK